MIKCKNCGNENTSFDPVCPHCKTEFELTEEEAKLLLLEAANCMKNRKFDAAVDLYRFLGSVGVSSGRDDL